MIKNGKASSPFMYLITAGLGTGLGWGVVKSFHLSLIANILAMLVVVLVMWLIFRQGRASSYATAQAWAQSVADAHSEAYSMAQAKAEALAEAYSLAISQANATATNTINLSLPDMLSGQSLPNRENALENDEVKSIPVINPVEYATLLLQEVKESENARQHGIGSKMAVGEHHSQTSSDVRESIDSLSAEKQ